MREFRVGLLRRDAQQMREMSRRWLIVERRLEARMEALAEDIARLRAAGEIVTTGQLRQMERYQALVADVRREVGEYERWAEGYVVAGQREMAALGVEQAAEAIMVADPMVGFDRVPLAMVERMAGLAADGSPLFDVLRARALWPEAVDGIGQVLVDAVTMGWSPRKTASRMADGLADGLQKALVIARSEQLRVYRHATVEQYRASGVVQAFRRLASKSDRTCLACLMADGEVIPLGQEMYDHPNGRCTSVPILIAQPMPQWETGRQWLEGLGAEKQREFMGDRLYEAWRHGQGFDLAQLVRVTYDATWGKSLGVRSLSELVA